MKKRDHSANPTTYIFYGKWLVPPKKPGATENPKREQGVNEKRKQKTASNYNTTEGHKGRRASWAVRAGGPKEPERAKREAEMGGLGTGGLGRE
mgnify:CR=1 FL=1